MTTQELQRREIAWYEQHGRYSERITRNVVGHKYVVGDWSWNRLHPDKPEVIERRMRRAGVYDVRRAGVYDE